MSRSRAAYAALFSIHFATWHWPHAGSNVIFTYSVFDGLVTNN